MLICKCLAFKLVICLQFTSDTNISLMQATHTKLAEDVITQTFHWDVCNQCEMSSLCRKWHTQSQPLMRFSFLVINRHTNNIYTFYETFERFHNVTVCNETFFSEKLFFIINYTYLGPPAPLFKGVGEFWLPPLEGERNLKN